MTTHAASFRSTCSSPVVIEVVSPTLRAGLRSLVQDLPDVLDGPPKRPVRIVDEQGLVGLDAGADVVAVLTTVDAEAVCRAVERGARGVVCRDGPAEDIRRAIIRVAEGGCWVSPEFSEQLHAVLAGVARDLGIAPGTVKGHVSEVLRRFGVATRAEAVAAALDVDAP